MHGRVDLFEGKQKKLKKKTCKNCRYLKSRLLINEIGDRDLKF